jgi:membrane protein involved in colicin uptake
LGTKAPLASPDLTGVPTAPTAAANTNTTQIATTAFAKAEADAAQSAAEATASGDATSKANAAQAAAEATASSALSGVTAGTTAFTAVNVNSVAKQIAATTGNIVTAAATTAYAWAKASYRSGEFLVKSKNGNHTEVAKIMVTLDSSDNVYITEYGMSSTSGVALQTVSADVSGTDVRIRVTPANNNTEVLITGTLLV